MAKKILVVDDEPQLVTAVAVRLRASGYQVEAAYDGEQGLRKAKEHKPDLIILDIVMPKMEGDVMAEALREDDKTRHIPIIFLTCLAEGIADRQKGCVISGTPFLAKPFDTEALLSMVDKVIKK